MTGNLRVLKVYVLGGREVYFDVLQEDNSVLKKVPESQMLNAVRNGSKFLNATVFDSGIIKANSFVPREDITQDCDPTRLR